MLFCWLKERNQNFLWRKTDFLVTVKRRDQLQQVSLEYQWFCEFRTHNESEISEHMIKASKHTALEQPLTWHTHIPCSLSTIPGHWSAPCTKLTQWNKQPQTLIFFISLLETLTSSGVLQWLHHGRTSNSQLQRTSRWRLLRCRLVVSQIWISLQIYFHLCIQFRSFPCKQYTPGCSPIRHTDTDEQSWKAATLQKFILIHLNLLNQLHKSRSLTQVVKEIQVHWTLQQQQSHVTILQKQIWVKQSLPPAISVSLPALSVLHSCAQNHPCQMI